MTKSVQTAIEINSITHKLSIQVPLNTWTLSIVHCLTFRRLMSTIADVPHR